MAGQEAAGCGLGDDTMTSAVAGNTRSFTTATASGANTWRAAGSPATARLASRAEFRDPYYFLLLIFVAPRFEVCADAGGRSITAWALLL
jgi:hypothetical protein